jgi:hypothetical protein
MASMLWSSVLLNYDMWLILLKYSQESWNRGPTIVVSTTIKGLTVIGTL